MKWVEVNRHINENFPERRGQLLFTVAELSLILGSDRHATKDILAEMVVPGYLYGKRVKYCLPEVIEALNRTRCK